MRNPNGGRNITSIACMFELAKYTVGSVIVGITISVIAIAVLFFVLKVIGRRKSHTPFSIGAAVLFSTLLIVFNIVFCGLVRAKNDATEYVQQGKIFELRGVDSSFSISFDENSEVKKINKYLWLDGFLCLGIFMAGILASYGFMEKPIKKVSNANRCYGYNDDF